MADEIKALELLTVRRVDTRTVTSRHDLVIEITSTSASRLSRARHDLTSTDPGQTLGWTAPTPVRRSKGQPFGVLTLLELRIA